jgi:transposase
MTINIGIRKLISSWIKSGYKAPAIHHMLNKTVSKATVYRWVDRILKSGVAARTSPGRPRSRRTKAFIAKVKRNLCSNRKRKSGRQLAREEGCSQDTVREIIGNDLGLKAYKKIRVPALTEAHVAQRLSFSHWIKNNFTHEKCRLILFSDEKIFNEDGSLNRQNDRVYAKSRQEANQNGGLLPTKKYPKKVMVWVGLAYNGKCKIVVLPPKQTFTANFYVENVLPIVNREGRKLIGDNFTFQQDGATSHTAEITIETIKNMGFSVISPDKWPANSPDLNPLDYFFGIKSRND